MESHVDFFCSKEYLSSYNPAFLHIKGRKEKEKIIGELFEIKQIDLDKEFYEILLSEKYKNLQRIPYSVLNESGRAI
jgi:hypothetical protein